MRSKEHSVRERAERFGSRRGPSVPPPKIYEPNRPTQRPAGYAEIEAASQTAQDSAGFIDFVRDVVNMPNNRRPRAEGRQRPNLYYVIAVSPLTRSS
jgi:hypothetical protein